MAASTIHDDTEDARLDVALVAAGLFESRAKAREAIEAGNVTVADVVVRRPAARVRSGAKVAAVPLYPWVSRGGLKLEAALDVFGIDPAGRVCLDVGASTGGFTEVLLARGAAHVDAVDVGRDQLHPRIRSDDRVAALSGTDVRALTAGALRSPPTLVTCDVSFISLRLVLPPVFALAAPGCDLIALVKPQFEVGKGRTSKGIVRDASLHRSACDAIVDLVASLGWRLSGVVPSPILGGDGNVEFLLGARRS